MKIRRKTDATAPYVLRVRYRTSLPEPWKTSQHRFANLGAALSFGRRLLAEGVVDSATVVSRRARRSSAR